MGLLLTACGGAQSLSESVIERAIEEAAEDEGLDVDIDFDDGGFTATTDEGEVQFGGGDRPDWLPGWVDLPEGLQITWSYQDADVGEAAITGWVAEGDVDDLVAAAKAMVEAAGYEVEGELETGAQGGGFNAYTFNAYTDDGTVLFGVVPLGDELQWGIEFLDEGRGSEPG